MATEEPPVDMKAEESNDSDIEMLEEESDEDVPKTPEEIAELAEEKKAQGNEHYKGKEYAKALELYSEAIDMCPDCAAYYSNRAATYMMISKYDKALEDARKSTTIDPNFIKGYIREGKCHLNMGEPVAAISCYSKVLILDPGNKTAKSELEQAKLLQQYESKADTCFDKGEPRTVQFCMDKCIQIASDCSRYKIRKAEVLALLKKYQESQEIANDILRFDSKNCEALYVRGLCLYYQDNVEKAFQHFQQVLKLAPDHQKARTVYKKAKQLKQKKDEGNEAFRMGKLEQAYKIYTEALEIDPLNIFTNSKLYNNRATVCLKTKKLDEAINDCTEAIKLDEGYLKAYHRRAKCYLDTEKYEDAVRDYEKILTMDKSRENKRLLAEAKLELKKSKRKDYYKLLGCNKDANEDDIKKAYKKRALLHHPDRHSNETDEVKKDHEKKFKECGEAYSVLSDPKKRARYDNGHDLEDLEGGAGFGDFDPNFIFQNFFGGGGGGGGGGFHQGGHGHNFHQQQQGFPGGFTFQFG